MPRTTKWVCIFIAGCTIAPSFSKKETASSLSNQTSYGEEPVVFPRAACCRRIVAGLRPPTSTICVLMIGSELHQHENALVHCVLWSRRVDPLFEVEWFEDCGLDRPKFSREPTLTLPPFLGRIAFRVSLLPKSQLVRWLAHLPEHCGAETECPACVRHWRVHAHRWWARSVLRSIGCTKARWLASRYIVVHRRA